MELKIEKVLPKKHNQDVKESKYIFTIKIIWKFRNGIYLLSLLPVLPSC